MLVYLRTYERDAKSAEPLAVFVSFFRRSEKVLEVPPFTISTGTDPKSKAVPFKLWGQSARWLTANTGARLPSLIQQLRKPPSGRPQ
jgi:hypothetical protein